MRAIVRRNIQGTMTLMGSYPVSTDAEACAKCEDEEDALNHYAKDNGHKDFKALCVAEGITRNEFHSEPVKE